MTNNDFTMYSMELAWAQGDAKRIALLVPWWRKKRAAILLDDIDFEIKRVRDYLASTVER